AGDRSIVRGFTNAGVSRELTRCQWLICERTDRWRRAVEGIAPGMLPGGFDRISSRVEGIRADEAVAWMRRVPTLIILYELAAEEPRETLQSLAIGAGRPHPPLQLVALAP